MKTALLLLALIPVQDKENSKDPEIRRVTLDYKDATLTRILEDLRKATGIPIELDEAARKKVDPDKDQFSIKITDLSLYNSLRLILQPSELTVKSVDKKKILITAEP
jgi:hypothetical protein